MCRGYSVDRVDRFVRSGGPIILTAVLFTTAQPLMSFVSKVAAQVVHPSEARILRPDVPVRSVSAEEVAPDSRFGRVALELGGYRQTASIGVLDGPTAEVFGEIRDVEVGPDGLIYVLDSQAREIRVFDRNGSLVRRGGREGEGPGELRHPRSIAVDREGRVYVGGLRRTIEVFDPADVAFEVVGRLEPDLSALGMCVVPSGLLLQGYHMESNRVFQHHAMDGSLRTRFGEVYEPDSPLLAPQMASGDIACGTGAASFVYAISSLPDVRGYGVNGEGRWIVLLPDHRPTITESTGDGGYRVRLPDEGWNRLFSVTVHGGHVLVQRAYVTREAQAEGVPFVRLESFLFDAGTGEGGYVGDRLPPIVAAGEECYVTQRTDAFPRLGAHCLGGGPDRPSSNRLRTQLPRSRISLRGPSPEADQGEGGEEGLNTATLLKILEERAAVRLLVTSQLPPGAP